MHDPNVKHPNDGVVGLGPSFYRSSRDEVRESVASEEMDRSMNSSKIGRVSNRAPGSSIVRSTRDLYTGSRVNENVGAIHTTSSLNPIHAMKRQKMERTYHHVKTKTGKMPPLIEPFQNPIGQKKKRDFTNGVHGGSTGVPMAIGSWFEPEQERKKKSKGVENTGFGIGNSSAYRMGHLGSHALSDDKPKEVSNHRSSIYPSGGIRTVNNSLESGSRERRGMRDINTETFIVGPKYNVRADTACETISKTKKVRERVHMDHRVPSRVGRLRNPSAVMEYPEVCNNTIEVDV